MGETSLLVAALVAFFLWRSYRQQNDRERQSEAERRNRALADAAVMVIDDDDAGWARLDFQRMLLARESRVYVMRRRAPGDWQVKQTSANARAEREWLKRERESEESYFEEEELEKLSKQIGESLKWHDMPTDILPEAERGYQRFVRARGEAETKDQ